MARARIDTSIVRHVVDGFDFPLGVYPVEDVRPIEGYTQTFEPADSAGYDPIEDREIDPDSDLPSSYKRQPPRSAGFGSDQPFGETFDKPYDPGSGEAADDFDGDDDAAGRDRGDERDGLGEGDRRDDLRGPRDGSGEAGFDGEWGQWPDRYVFDINIRASRVQGLCHQLFGLLPGRVYPILDVMGNDAFREIDPYIAYDLVGIERFYDAVRRFQGWFYEDGTVGFGAMSESPFVYVFVDEHKIVTVRVDATMKEQVERILAAFDLKEVDKIAGADAAVHEHRGVLDPDASGPDTLNHEELVEEVRDRWGLTLNVDPLRNAGEDDEELGITAWRCVVRVFSEGGAVRYAEVILTAPHLQAAGDMAISAVEHLDPALSPETPPDDQEPSDFDVLWADRLDDDDLAAALGDRAGEVDRNVARTISSRWLS